MASKIYPSVKPVEDPTALEANASDRIRGVIKPLTKPTGYDDESGKRDPAVPTKRWIKALKEAIG